MAWYWWLLIYAALLGLSVLGWSRFMGNVKAHDVETRRTLGLPEED